MLAWLNLHTVYMEARDEKKFAYLYNVFSFSAFWDTAAKQNLFPLESVDAMKYTHLSFTEETVISLYRCGMPDLGINGVGIKEVF